MCCENICMPRDFVWLAGVLQICHPTLANYGVAFNSSSKDCGVVCLPGAVTVADSFQVQAQVLQLHSMTIPSHIAAQRLAGSHSSCDHDVASSCRPLQVSTTKRTRKELCLYL